MATEQGSSAKTQEKPQHDVSRMRKAFQRTDSNSSGTIPNEQFTSAAQEVGVQPTEDELDELFEHFDKTTDDSEINFGEFLDMMAYLEDGEKDYESCLRQAFKKFDRDGSGYISPEELRYVVCNTGEKFSQSEAEELISMFDTNHDGQLSWEEFVTFIEKSMSGQEEEECVQSVEVQGKEEAALEDDESNATQE